MKEKVEKYSPLKLILIMGIPPILSMLIQSLYSIIDAIFISSISDNAFTAISLAFPLQNIILSLAVGIGIGINSCVSRTLGEGKVDQAKSLAAKGFMLFIYHYLLLVVLGLIIIPFFFNLFTDNTDVISQGKLYLYILVFFSFGQLGHIAVEKILQANGNMIAPTLFQILGCIINIVLDALFILVFDFGIAGAAFATIIGQIVSFITILIYCLKHKYIKISSTYFKYNKEIASKIYSVAIPSFLFMVFPSILTLILNAILKTYSQDHISVLGAYFKLQTFIYMPASGLIQGLRPIFGYFYGNKDKIKLYSSLKNGLLLLLIIMIFGCFLFLLLPYQLMSLFTSNDNIINIGVIALRIISIGFIPSAISLIIVSLFEAIGKGQNSLLISLARLLAIPALFSITTTFILNLDSIYIWMSFAIAEWISVFIAIFIFIKFIKKNRNHVM